jgi:hypothetical protein
MGIDHAKAGILVVANVTCVALAVTITGCSGEPPVPVGDAIGRTLAEVTAFAPDDAGFLIQDSSPRVGLAASFALGTSDAEEWTVVAICADAADLHDADAVEVAVIPSATYPEVAEQVDDGEFRDLVTCDGLAYR